jgi:hypothetical protein
MGDERRAMRGVPFDFFLINFSGFILSLIDEYL